VSPVELPGEDLLAVLAQVPDPRDARGRRHRLVALLAIGVCAVLAGARSYVAIAEWAHDLPVSARLRLGIGRRAPSESTIRRILQAVDLDALDVALSGWLADRPQIGRGGAIGSPLLVTGPEAPNGKGGSEKLSDGGAGGGREVFAALEFGGGPVAR
jgi:hypothetical protein